MAADNTPSALKKLEQQLTCAVCFDIYSNPKSLPCHHSFCLHCLEGLSVNPQGKKRFINCPTCRTSTELPEPTGPAAFPVAFHINNLKEVYSLMKQEKPMNNSMHTIDGLKRPYGVAVNDKHHVIVTEYHGNCITVLDREGRKIKSFTGSGNIKLSYPCGVAITPDNLILVTDNHKIQKLTMDGKLIASVGQQGSKELEFICPRGITVSPITGHIYVADRENHRIQVLNPDLTFSYLFGIKGSAEGQFNSPEFIAIDNQGFVYISDTGNHRVQVFTSEGNYISQFGTYGCGPGQLQSPTGIVINNNKVYVVEQSNHRVSVFTTDGQFLHSFGERGNKKDQFNVPQCITLHIDEDYLYICDLCNDRLVMYHICV